MSSAKLDAEEAIASEPRCHVGETRVNGERRQGKELRETTARRAHATWEPVGRPDPLESLAETCVDRVKQLVPIRFGRMLQSPLAFLRGAPLIMARDLSSTARTGVLVQACGDAHLLNFGLFASPERNLLFDINDFDETLHGPWEWDLKRLAASIVVASRTYGHPHHSESDCALACGRAYRQNILCYSKRPLLDVWYSRVDGENVLKEYQQELRKRIARKIDKAEKCDQRNAVSELAEDEGGCLKFVENPPILTHASGELSERGLDRILKSYRRSLQDDRRYLFDGYNLVDFALKVVGVGSVGTRCFAALFRSGRKNDCIVLQIKEATPSVFEGLAKTNWNGNQGQRTVVGQRLIQGFTDIFLGWGSDGERDFYIRQLRDMKGQLSAQTSSVDELEHYAGLCGWTLARAHARSGNSAIIAGYLGRSDVFDKALADFAVSYADQVARDFDVFKAAVKVGRFPAERGI
jgi:uncharacterized protein (DUF2252 family)